MGCLPEPMQVQLNGHRNLGFGFSGASRLEKQHWIRGTANNRCMPRHAQPHCTSHHEQTQSASPSRLQRFLVPEQPRYKVSIVIVYSTTYTLKPGLCELPADGKSPTTSACTRPRASFPLHVGLASYTLLDMVVCAESHVLFLRQASICEVGAWAGPKSARQASRDPPVPSPATTSAAAQQLRLGFHTL